MAEALRLTTIDGQILALLYARAEPMPPRTIVEALGLGDKRITDHLTRLQNDSRVVATGSTRNRAYEITKSGRKTQYRKPGAEHERGTVSIAQVAGDFDMSLKARAIGDRARAPHVDPTVRVRQATPEELACLSPRESSSAPAAAARSSEENDTTRSTAPPSTPAPWGCFRARAGLPAVR